jgi:hypothetical protein
MNTCWRRIEFFGPSAKSSSVDRSGTFHSSGSRQTSRTPKTQASGLRRQARHHPGLVSQARCTAIRWAPAAAGTGPGPDRSRLSGYLYRTGRSDSLRPKRVSGLFRTQPVDRAGFAPTEDLDPSRSRNREHKVISPSDFRTHRSHFPFAGQPERMPVSSAFLSLLRRSASLLTGSFRPRLPMSITGVPDG